MYTYTIFHHLVIVWCHHSFESEVNISFSEIYNTSLGFHWPHDLSKVKLIYKIYALQVWFSYTGATIWSNQFSSVLMNLHLWPYNVITHIDSIVFAHAYTLAAVQYQVVPFHWNSLGTDFGIAFTTFSLQLITWTNDDKCQIEQRFIYNNIYKKESIFRRSLYYSGNNTPTLPAAVLKFSPITNHISFRSRQFQLSTKNSIIETQIFGIWGGILENLHFDKRSHHLYSRVTSTHRIHVTVSDLTRRCSVNYDHAGSVWSSDKTPSYCHYIV